MNEGKQMFIELLVGIIILGALCAIPGIFWSSNRLSYYIGLFIGVVVSMVLTYDMYSSLDKGLTMEAKKASGYIKKKVIFRFCIVIIVFFIAAFIEQIEILSVLLGTLTLKFSAYIQPLTHKFLAKNK